MTDEEKKAIENLKIEYEKLIKEDNILFPLYKSGAKRLIDIIEKQSKEIEELKREKETNQQMIHLAETQILGYGQGYKDGLNKETTATAIVARERENQIIYEGIKHKIDMEWVFKIKAKIEEVEQWELYNMKIPKLSTLDERLGAKIGIKYILQSLLEKE